LSSVGIHSSSQWLWDRPRSAAGHEGYPDMRFNQDFTIPHDPLMQGDGGTFHHLWLGGDLEHIFNSGGLEEIDLH